MIWFVRLCAKKCALFIIFTRRHTWSMWPLLTIPCERWALLVVCTFVLATVYTHWCLSYRIKTFSAFSRVFTVHVNMNVGPFLSSFLFRRRRGINYYTLGCVTRYWGYRAKGSSVSVDPCPVQNIVSSLVESRVNCIIRARTHEVRCEKRGSFLN